MFSKINKQPANCNTKKLTKRMVSLIPLLLITLVVDLTHNNQVSCGFSEPFQSLASIATESWQTNSDEQTSYNNDSQPTVSIISSLSSPFSWPKISLSLTSDADQDIELGHRYSDEVLRKEEEFRKLKRSPVILLPGYGGSRLEAKWNKKQVEHYLCALKADWTDIWINVKLLLPYMIDCLIENMRLEYDYATNSTKNTQGVQIRVKDPNSVSSVEYLNNLRISGFAYFAPIIRKLTMGLGYKREQNIRGAPYDFRKAPNELDYYFDHLLETSKQLYENNNGRPITYICHSMGCNNILYFLHRQSKAWKDKHVKRIISIAAPWAGALSALRAVAMGDNLGMPYLFDETKLIKVQRSLPSTIYLFPHKQVFGNVPLISSNMGYKSTRHSSPSTVEFGNNSTKLELETQVDKHEISANNVDADDQHETKLSRGKVFRGDDYKEFFEAIEHPDGYQMWLSTKDLLGNIQAPGVEVWCLVGVGQKTLSRLEFEGPVFKSSFTEILEDGDGTVTLMSAKYCSKWSNEQKEPIYVREFSINHMEILKDPKVVKYIEQILDSESARSALKIN